MASIFDLYNDEEYEQEFSNNADYYDAIYGSVHNISPHTTDHRTSGALPGEVTGGASPGRPAAESESPQWAGFNQHYNSNQQIRAARGDIRASINAQIHTRSMQSLLGQDNFGEGPGTPFRFRGQGNNLRLANTQTGEMLLNENQVSQAFDAARGVLDQASMGAPGRSEDLFGTIVSRLNKAIGKLYDDQIREATTNAGAEIGRTMKYATKQFANAILNEAGISSETGVGQSQRSAYYDHTQNLNILGREGAMDYISSQPAALQARVTAFGFERAFNSPQSVWFGDDQGGGIQLGGWGGGGSGGGGGGRGRSGGIWGGTGGQLMHGMYMAQRMWGYTAGPVMEQAQAYATGQSEYAGLYTEYTGRDAIGSNYGMAARSGVVQGMMQRAAYQQVGAFADFGYMAAGADSAEAGARIAQGTMVGAGVAGVSIMAGGALGLSGLGPAGIVAGGFMALGSIQNEIDNIRTGDDRGVSEKYTDAFIQQAGVRARTRALQAAGVDLSKMTSVEQQERAAAAAGITQDDIVAQFENENVANLWQGSLGGRGFDALQGALSGYATKSGGDEAKTIKYGQLMTKIAGAASTRFVEQLEGVTGASDETMAEVLTMAGQAGIGIGDISRMGSLVNTFSQASPEERAQMVEQYGQYAQIGGALAPYMNSTSNAQSLAARHQMTMGAARVAQAYMAVGTQFGADMEEVLSYEISRVESVNIVTPITRADAIAMRSKERTPYQASIDVSVGGLFMQSGMTFERAMNQAEFHGFERESQVTTFSNWMSQSESFSGAASEARATQLAQLSLTQSAAQGAMISGVASRMAVGGQDAYSTLGGLGLGNQQMANLTAAYGGDVKAASFMDATGQANIPGLSLFDSAGRSMVQYSGAGAMRTAYAQQGTGNPYAGGFIGAVSNLNERNRGLFDAGGIQAVEQDYRDRGRDLQRASIGLGFAKIAENQRYLWGADQGGTWDDPTSGSMWGLQDTQRAMQHRSTLAGFAMQRRRMDINTEFSVASEDLQSRRMGTSHEFQDWQSGFNRQNTLMQRGYQVQAWQAQDQSTALQFGWQMEDMDEAIRMSGGRDRRKLVEQKERATLMHNLTGQNTENQRSNQEEMWAREDERYEKQTEYQETLQAYEEESFEMQVNRRQTLTELDEEDFERQKKEYEEMRKLNEQMIKVEREHQAKMMDFQLAGLGIQAAQLALQEEQEEQLEPLKEQWAAMAGYIEQISKYDIAEYMLSLEGVAAQMAEVDPEAARGTEAALTTFANIEVETAVAVGGALDAFEGTLGASTSVRKMLEEMEDIDNAGVSAVANVFKNSKEIDQTGVYALSSLIRSANSISVYKVNVLKALLDQF